MRGRPASSAARDLPARLRRVGLGARLLAILGPFLGACSLLFDGELDVIACEDEGAFGPPACPEGRVCSGGVCAAGEPIALGSPCEDDGACAAGDRCLDPAAFGLAPQPGGEQAPPPRCSRLCCSSGECGEPEGGFVCWTPPGAPMGYCLAAEEIGRARGGRGKPGEPCYSNLSCRSGRCEGGVCWETCCADVNCAASGAACRLEPASPDGHARFVCDAAGEGTRPYLAPCDGDEACASRLCLPFEGMGTLCSAACCGSDACGTVTRGGVASPVACAYVERPGGAVRACARILPPEAVGAVGAPCGAASECRGGACLEAPGAGGEGRICSDTCCLDASCGDPDFACRPGGESGRLRCEPK